MTVGENIHNAFVVVFRTLQAIEKLIRKCRAELDTKTYYMPEERFLRHSSDQNWEGWIYWSFILLFQRREDGPVMENGWIDGPGLRGRDQCGFGHLRCAEGLYSKDGV